jgi:hypothetical protein
MAVLVGVAVEWGPPPPPVHLFLIVGATLRRLALAALASVLGVRAALALPTRRAQVLGRFQLGVLAGRARTGTGTGTGTGTLGGSLKKIERAHGYQPFATISQCWMDLGWDTLDAAFFHSLSPQ